MPATTTPVPPVGAPRGTTHRRSGTRDRGHRAVRLSRTRRAPTKQRCRPRHRQRRAPPRGARRVPPAHRGESSRPNRTGRPGRPSHVPQHREPRRARHSRRREAARRYLAPATTPTRGNRHGPQGLRQRTRELRLARRWSDSRHRPGKSTRGRRHQPGCVQRLPHRRARSQSRPRALRPHATQDPRRRPARRAASKRSQGSAGPSGEEKPSPSKSTS